MRARRLTIISKRMIRGESVIKRRPSSCHGVGDIFEWRDFVERVEVVAELTWYRVIISTSRRPSRRHKAPNPHVLSWRTWLANWPVGYRSHNLDSAARTPTWIRYDRPIHSYPAQCTCDHTAGSVLLDGDGNRARA